MVNWNWTEDCFYKVAEDIADKAPDLCGGNTGLVSELAYDPKQDRYSCTYLLEDLTYVDLNFALDFGGGYPVPNDIQQYRISGGYSTQYIGGHNKHEEFKLEQDPVDLLAADLDQYWVEVFSKLC